MITITIVHNKYGYRVLDDDGDELGCADNTESSIEDHTQVILELLSYLNIPCNIKLEGSK